jgi:hypothetical protein
MSKVIRCKDCKWFDLQPIMNGKYDGFCRLNPPVWLIDQTDDISDECIPSAVNRYGYCSKAESKRTK